VFVSVLGPILEAFDFFPSPPRDAQGRYFVFEIGQHTQALIYLSGGIGPVLACKKRVFAKVGH
jgi:hypothetical protein